MTFSLRTCLVLIIVFLSGSSFAYEQNYSATGIPAELLKNAHTVIRNSQMKMNIVSAEEVYVTYSYAVTVMNEEGVRNGILRMPYGDFVRIESMQGKLYDGSGKQLLKLKKKDAKDFGLSSNFVDDDHFKVFDFKYRSYPYTCEYEVVLKYKQSFSLPDWDPQTHYAEAVQSASIEITYPKDLSFRFRTINMDKKPTVEIAEGVAKLTATVNNLTAIPQPDDFAPVKTYYNAAMTFAIDNFKVEDLEGNMATWKELGTFFYKLNADRDTLSATARRKVHELTDTCHSDARKISALYDYLKHNTRYVSIQLGIGGWQTATANSVSEKGYGDCKALSNYMKALLKEAGVTAHATLAYADDENKNPMPSDFPTNAFNHVILCVPTKTDTTWLECTAKNLPVGYLSSFTDNRSVLMCTPDGGYPVKTPRNALSENALIRSADIYLSDKGEMKGAITLSYSGLLWEREQPRVMDRTKTEIDNYMSSRFAFSNYTIDNYKISDNSSHGVPTIGEEITFTGGGNIFDNNGTIFLTSSTFRPVMAEPLALKPRIDSFKISRSYQVKDSVTFHLNGSFTLQSPKKEILEYPFANYSYTCTLEQNNILKITTHCTFIEGVYAPDLFADYIKLYKQLKNNATYKAVLKKAS